MRNPFSHHHVDAAHMQREIREAYAHDGWGTSVVRTVAQPEGQPFAFQLQLPDDQRLIEMSDLTDAAQSTGEVPAWVGDKAMDLKAAAAVPGVILVGAIVSADDPADVIATATAFAAENVGPLDLPKGSHTADGANVFSSGTMTDPVYGHMDDIRLAYRDPQGELLPPVTLRHFVMEQAGGKVSLTLVSTKDGMGGHYGLDYMSQIAKSVWYGPQDAPE
jgi:hypothetical protein